MKLCVILGFWVHCVYAYRVYNGVFGQRLTKTTLSFVWIVSRAFQLYGSILAKAVARQKAAR